jgi:hypothetical protein
MKETNACYSEIGFSGLEQKPINCHCTFGYSQLLRGINEVAIKKCEMTHCVNNLDGYCQSRVNRWLGLCRFKRKPEADEA